MFKTLLITAVLLLAAVLLLGVKVLFVKGGKFPSGHVGGNAELRRRGISCASGHRPPPQSPKRP